MARLKAEISKPLNFEMAATEDMLRISLATKPHAVCLVPERREELTTEGGLDVVGQHNALAPFIARLNDAGIRVSLFIAADPQPDRNGGQAARAGDRNPHRRLVRRRGRRPHGEGRSRMAAHRRGRQRWRAPPASRSMPATASITQTAETIAALPEIVELNIGYFMIGEALFVGLAETVRAMRAAMDRGRKAAREHELIMIIGIGSDLIDISRVAKVIERHGDRFLDRIFTDAERAKAERRANNEKMVVATYAKRFAAKEACSKALGTGIRRGVWWRDMGVVNLPGGRPTMQLTGGALARLEALTPEGFEARIDLSITDDWPLAQAFVIISAVVRGKPESPAAVAAGDPAKTKNR